MTDLETKMVAQLDELTKRVNNLEMVVFISTMSQVECVQPAADKINKTIMKMFFKVSRSFGQFESIKPGQDLDIKAIGLVFKNGDKL